MSSELSEKLEDTYIQSLEIDLIQYLSSSLNIDNRLAMRIYFNSRLCQQIHDRTHEIQYLDYKYLAEDLIENELSNLYTVSSSFNEQ